MIDAENLGKFRKPKHFVNFIQHLEAYKAEFNKLPHEHIHADLSLAAAFPGLPGGKKDAKKADAKKEAKDPHH